MSTLGPAVADAPIAVLGESAAVRSVADAISLALPREDLVVLADQAYAPYALRPSTVVRDRVGRLLEELAGYGPKLVIVASPCAISDGIAGAGVPMMELQTGVHQAAARRKRGRVAVIVDADSVRQRPFSRLVQATFAGDEPIIARWPGIRAVVDGDRPADARIEAGLHQLVAEGVTALALACPAAACLRDAIEELTPYLVVIDCATVTAGRVHRQLVGTGACATRRRPGRQTRIGTAPVRAA